MGNFEDHMRWAFGAHIIAVLLVGVVASVESLSLLWLGVAAVGLPLTLMGGAFPDIDHHASKPNSVFKDALTLGAGVAGGYIAATRGMPLLESTAASYGLPPLGGIVGGAVLSFAAVGLGARVLFSKVRPTHRGVTHRVPTGLLVSAGVAVVVTVTLSESPMIAQPLVFGGIGGGLFFVGVLSHLACDGMLTSLETYISLR